MAIDQLRELGSDVLTDWGKQKLSDRLQSGSKDNLKRIKHIEEVNPLTICGLIGAEEQVLRFGRRGRDERSF